MTKTTPVHFTNRKGLRLYGMLEEPGSGQQRKDTAVLILSPGIKMRVGPHRLYNKFSRRLAEAGYPVLRYDFYGLGDSQGEVDERELVNVYNSIQDGRYIEDTLDAMDWMGSEYKLSRFILSGLCGGAITGLLAGCDDHRVEGLLALGLINVFEGGEDNFSRYVTDGELELLVPGYIEKLTDPASWKRLLTLKSDFRAIYKIFLLPFKKLLQHFWNSDREEQLPSELLNPVPQGESNVNPKFGPAFFKMLTNNKRMLLIYSGQDRLVHEFSEKFADKYRPYLERYGELYDMKIIDNANHILSDPNWEAAMHEHALEWLGKNF